MTYPDPFARAFAMAIEAMMDLAGSLADLLPDKQDEIKGAVSLNGNQCEKGANHDNPA